MGSSSTCVSEDDSSRESSVYAEENSLSNINYPEEIRTTFSDALRRNNNALSNSNSSHATASKTKQKKNVTFFIGVAEGEDEELAEDAFQHNFHDDTYDYDDVSNDCYYDEEGSEQEVQTMLMNRIESEVIDMT